MTNIFDNASSITINNKEVATIQIGNGIIFQAEQEEPITDMVLKVTGSSFNSYNTSPFGISGSLEVDWGDGETTTYSSGKLSHTYAESGTYDITLKGTITQIKAQAFQGVTNLKEVIIPNSVTSIQYNCFKGCTGLTRIVVGANITSTSASMCNGCTSLTEAVLPKTIQTLDDSTFEKSSNLVVNLPNGLTTLNANCFRFSGVQEITIPQTVTSMGSGVFKSCSGLSTVTFKGVTPPTIGTEAFMDVPSTCVIRVPSGSLSAYTSASGYPDPNTYTYEEY